MKLAWLGFYPKNAPKIFIELRIIFVGIKGNSRSAGNKFRIDLMKNEKIIFV
jgi:hypothetical protein